jgi:hypothetical protein
MIRSYLKVALRNLYRNKFYSVINIVGLGVAMAICVVGYVNYQFGQSFDSYHENAEKIFLLCNSKGQGNNVLDWSVVPMPMLPAIREGIPGIEKVSRIGLSGGTVRYGDKVFREAFHYVDEDYFDMFTFPVMSGDDDVLRDKSALVITDEIAEKYFGDENPIGKELILSVEPGQEFLLTVRAIITKPPMNSSMQISICLPYERLQDIREYDIDSWDNWTRGGFIQIADHASLPEIEQKLQAYVQTANDANPDWQINAFHLCPLPQLASASRDLRGAPFTNGLHPAALVAPAVTALLVLLLACFNFVNTAIAYSSRRLNEIGIRKVVGGVRGQLVKQFLGENLVLCFIAMLVAAVLAEIFVPAYDSLWPELSLTMDYSENLGVVGFFIGLLLFTAVAAGAWPAFYISAFKPVDILKGKQKLGGTNPLIRVLLTFQFALSITSIIAFIDKDVTEGLVTMEKVRVIKYRHK